MESFLSFWSDVVLFFHSHVLLSLGSLLLFGFTFGRLCERIKLPAITGYIAAGLLLGPSVSGLIGESIEPGLSTITKIALGLIALTIGGGVQLRKT